MARGKALTVETAFTSYTLGDVIGQGGAGRVFVASDASGNEWALKMLNPKQATTDRRRRFKNEIRFGERIKHPNIVAVTDHGVAQTDEGAAPFYVMPRYAGSFRDSLKQAPDPQRRLQHFDQILSGVEAAHLHGVIHRDIKPENVLVDKTSTTLVIADFGIAHFTDEDLYTAVETKAAARLANFQYAAPEQRVRGRVVGASADIYALGLMLNEMFTGAVPHGTAYRTIGSAFPDYTWLDSLVEAMLRQQPEGRPASIDIVKRMLLANRQDYVIRQRLDALKNAVVPAGTITDPLADTPPTIVDFHWAKGVLTLFLSAKITPQWVYALQNMGSHSSVWGKGPEAFRFDQDRAVITANEHQVQQIIDYFKSWVPRATQKYRSILENEWRVAAEQEKQRLRAEQEELERQQRLRQSIKL